MSKVSDDKRFEYCDAIQLQLKQAKKHDKRSIEKLAETFGIFNKNLVKEMTELAICRLAREIASNETITPDERFEKIVELYYNQVNLSHRTSASMLFQQYSTPAPISYVASMYVLKSCDPEAKYLEPSAGNGLLTIALPYEKTTVNELDDVRLENLKSQPFASVTRQDATIPFTDYRLMFSGVVTNPPFGSLMAPEIYDGFPISTLDHLMALRALDCMKNDGRAAIIIGGHTTWDEQGRIQAGKNRLFFNYLYSHYNVDDVVLISGKKLYTRQGTGFDVRLILIDGRKEKVEGFAPLKNDQAAEIVSDYDRLWERVSKNLKKIVSEKDTYLYNISKLKLKMRMKAASLQLDELSGANEQEIGDFGPIYRQFEKEPKKAIKHLMKVKRGEAVKALYRSDVGYIDIVWGENDPNTNKGFGLKHIIEKHGEEIKQLGFEVADFIPICVQSGVLDAKAKKNKIFLESKMFRIVVKTQFNGKKKTFLLSAFDLRYKK